MRATLLCPAPHIEAFDLDGDTSVTIEGVGFEKVGIERETKGVIYFTEFERGLVINRTNLKRMIEMLGGETTSWEGEKIILYASETEYEGVTVPCVRVRGNESITFTEED